MEKTLYMRNADGSFNVTTHRTPLIPSGERIRKLVWSWKRGAWEPLYLAMIDELRKLQKENSEWTLPTLESGSLNW